MQGQVTEEATTDSNTCRERVSLVCFEHQVCIDSANACYFGQRVSDIADQTSFVDECTRIYTLRRFPLLFVLEQMFK